MVLGGRGEVGVAVHGTAGRDVDDAPDRGAPGGVEEAERAEHVDARVETRVGDRAWDGRLGGQVDDGVRSRGRQRVVEPRAPEVADEEARRRVDALASTGREVVEGD